MHRLELARAFTLIEPGPVVLVTTHDGSRDNVMTISWTTVVDFTPILAMVTGPWNHSFTALRKTRECVIAVPTVDLLDRVVGVGTCSGKEVDKFSQFGFTRLRARHVKAPLIKECVAHIECKVVEILKKHSLVILEGVAAHHDPTRPEQRRIHAIGDGRFIVDGQTLDRRQLMASKLPAGV